MELTQVDLNVQSSIFEYVSVSADFFFWCIAWHLKVNNDAPPVTQRFLDCVHSFYV